MSKNDILIFGMILQACTLIKRHDITEEDDNLLKAGLMKVYGGTEKSTEEELEAIDSMVDEDMKKMLSTYREKVSKFVSSEEHAE